MFGYCRTVHNKYPLVRTCELRKRHLMECRPFGVIALVSSLEVYISSALFLSYFLYATSSFSSRIIGSSMPCGVPSVSPVTSNSQSLLWCSLPFLASQPSSTMVRIHAHVPRSSSRNGDKKGLCWGEVEHGVLIRPCEQETKESYVENGQ